MEGGERLDSKYLRFGKAHAERRQLRDLFPGQYTEYKIEVEIDGIPILCYLDFYDRNTHTFEDDKTGKIPFTKARLQKSQQMLFYAMALKYLTGNLPESCTINWFETKEEGGGGLQNDINFTGKEKSFTRYFNEREIEPMRALLVRVANEISNAYREFLNEI